MRFLKTLSFLLLPTLCYGLNEVHEEGSSKQIIAVKNLQPYDPCLKAVAMAHPQFLTGEDIWQRSNIQNILMLSEQFQNQYSEIYECLKTLEGFCETNISGRISIRESKGTVVQFIVSKNTSAHYHLFLAFHHALKEISEVVGTLYAQNQYVRSDLEVIKDFLAHSIYFLRQTEALGKTKFQGELESEDFKGFAKKLQEAPYLPAQEIRKRHEAFYTEVLQRENKNMTMYEYVAKHSDFYALSLLNAYVQVREHLRSKDVSTRILLRRQKGNLHKFQFSFTPASLVSLEPQEELNTPLAAGAAEAEKPSLSKSKKRRMRAKAKTLMNQVQALSLPATAAPAAPLELSPQLDLPPLLDEKVPMSLVAPTSPPLLSSLETEPAQDPFVSSPLRNEGEKALKASVQKNKELLQKEDMRITRLENLLLSYEKSQFAGVKARHFLTFARTLNKLGYFDEFEANDYELKIKMKSEGGEKPFMTSIHMDHHRGRESTVKTESARKMDEVVDRLLQTHLARE